MPRPNLSDLYKQTALGVQDWLTVDVVPVGSTIVAGSRLIGNTALPDGTYKCFISAGGLTTKITALLKATFGAGSVTITGGTVMMDQATVITALGGGGAMVTTVRNTVTITPVQGEQLAMIQIVVAGGAAPVFTEGEFFGN